MSAPFFLPCSICGAPAGEINEVVPGKVWSVQCSARQLRHNTSAMSWEGPEDLANSWNERPALIAAAPDLLQALQLLEDKASFAGISDSRERRDVGEALQQARAAIAKATGEQA